MPATRRLSHQCTNTTPAAPRLACDSDWFCSAARGRPIRSPTPARTLRTKPVGLNSSDSEPSTCAWEQGK